MSRCPYDGECRLTVLGFAGNRRGHGREGQNQGGDFAMVPDLFIGREGPGSLEIRKGELVGDGLTIHGVRINCKKSRAKERIGEGRREGDRWCIHDIGML